MSVRDTKEPSRTDWARLDKMTDEEIDTSDVPELGDDFFERATFHKPKPISVVIKVDPDVLAWFESQGDAFEKRMNAALRIYAEAHK